MARHKHALRRTVTRCALLSAGFLLVGPLFAAGAFGQAKPNEEWVVPERRARRPNPVPATADVIARGRELFRRECRSCHGAVGRGDGPDAADLDTKVPDLTTQHVREQKDGALFWKITEGRGDMPNSRTALTDEQRWMIVHYLRTLGAQTGTPRASGGLSPT